MTVKGDRYPRLIPDVSNRIHEVKRPSCGTKSKGRTTAGCRVETGLRRGEKAVRRFGLASIGWELADGLGIAMQPRRGNFQTRRRMFGGGEEE
jgi:hypothetical protein